MPKKENASFITVDIKLVPRSDKFFGIGTLGCLLTSTTRLTCFPYIRGHTWPEEILHDLVFGSYCADMSCHWCGVCQLDHFIVPVGGKHNLEPLFTHQISRLTV